MSPVDCEHVLKEIELYLDGELGGEVCAEIREHLSGCSPCMGRTEFRRRLRGLLAAKCGCEEMPAELRERIQFLLRDPRVT